MLIQLSTASSLWVPEDSKFGEENRPSCFQALYITNFRGQTLWPETCDEDVLVPRKQKVEKFPAGCGGVPLPGSYHEGSSSIPLPLGLAILVLLQPPGKAPGHQGNWDTHLQENVPALTL